MLDAGILQPAKILDKLLLPAGSLAQFLGGLVKPDCRATIMNLVVAKLAVGINAYRGWISAGGVDAHPADHVLALAAQIIGETYVEVGKQCVVAFLVVVVLARAHGYKLITNNAINNIN